MTISTSSTTKAKSSPALGYDPTGIHQSEAVCSTPLSSLLHLYQLNRWIHSIRSLPHCAEFIVFLFGYAFNPVSIPLWMVAVTFAGAVPAGEQMKAQPPPPATMPLFFAPTFYLASAIVTLIGTEVCKATFQATRPEALLSKEFRNSKIRRYGTLVASLKSKHSFPSGDSAQAFNLVLFCHKYILLPLVHNTNANTSTTTSTLQQFAINSLLFGIFYPGVAFARIFYHCHWIEDCLGGALLAFLLHRAIIPLISDMVATQFLEVIS